MFWLRGLMSSLIQTVCIFQEHEAVLSKVLDDGISLDPLKTVIQELASAAKEAEDEAQVKLEKLIKNLLICKDQSWLFKAFQFILSFCV